MHNQIRLEPDWIPREYNEQTDYKSKTMWFVDWMLNPEVFATLDSKFG